ncbi:MAG: rhomboid family intramembrane serine protease [Catalinimonas sp.]
MNFQLTPVVKNLLLINVGLLAAEYLMVSDSSMFSSLFAQWFGLRYVLADSFRPWQFLTYMFIHAGLSHIFFNMLGLFFFGPLLERFWGSKRFLIFYLATGLGAGVLYSAINFYETYSFEQEVDAYVRDPNPDDFVKLVRDHEEIFYGVSDAAIESFARYPDNADLQVQTVRVANEALLRKENLPMIGASGCVFGILAAFGLLFPNTKLFLLFPPIPVKAKYIVIFYGVTALFGAIRDAPGDNVAHYAHLGGMVFGWLLVMLWGRDRNRFY